MKRLATISCRLGGQDCHCAFSFSRPLTAVGHDYFKDPRSLLATREGEVCMKYKDHHMRHPRGHLGDQASAQRTRGCAWRDEQFGRGQNILLGWSDPTFAHGSVAKVMLGVAPAHTEISAGVLPACLDGFQTKPVKKVRITLCTFKLATSSPDARRTALVLKDLRKPNPGNLPRRTGQIVR